MRRRCAIRWSASSCRRISVTASTSPSRATAARPLPDYALASRLSYFLWSSMPDAELLAQAAAGDLHRPDVLTAQARRLLRDPRVLGLATEFGGNWLDFRRFEEHNAVDRERFPGFTNELRTAMFEEPIRYFDRHGKAESLRTRFALRRRYIRESCAGPSLRYARTAGERMDSHQGRRALRPRRDVADGGLPHQERAGPATSPVKRGYWVVRRLLGEVIPPPPPTVPELPKDEAALGELTLPQVLARHRADKSCAGCHDRFDSIGLTFEGYGPVGELRTKDLGGRPVETTATFPDGVERKGLAGFARVPARQAAGRFRR